MLHNSVVRLSVFAVRSEDSVDDVLCCRLTGCLLIYRCYKNGGRLFGVFIFSAFVAGIPMTLSVASSNVAEFTKKATVSAMMFVTYCTGNIVGPFLFFSREAPAYKVSGELCFSLHE